MSVQVSLHIFHKYCVQMAALSWNVIFCNQTWSAMGEFINFVRHIGGSTWWRSMHGASQRVVTNHHAPDTYPSIPRNYFRRPKYLDFIFEGFFSFTSLQQCNLSVSYTDGCGFSGLEIACWPLVPKFAGSHPAEAVGFLGRKNPQHVFLRRGSKAIDPMS